MNAKAAKAAEVLQLAESFRQRAAEAGDALYHRLMLRTALDLEEFAESLVRPGDLVMIDDGEDDEVEDA